MYAEFVQQFMQKILSGLGFYQLQRSAGDSGFGLCAQEIGI